MAWDGTHNKLVLGVGQVSFTCIIILNDSSYCCVPIPYLLTQPSKVLPRQHSLANYWDLSGHTIAQSVFNSDVRLTLQ